MPGRSKIEDYVAQDHCVSKIDECHPFKNNVCSFMNFKISNLPKVLVLSGGIITPKEKSNLFSELAALKKVNAKSVQAFDDFRTSFAVQNFTRDAHFKNQEKLLKEILAHYPVPLATQPPASTAVDSSFDDDKKGEKVSEGEQLKKKDN